MLAAKNAILMHDAMRACRGGFAVADIVEAGFKDFEVRAQLRFWIKRGAVEVLQVRASRNKRHVVLHKVTTALPPVIATAGENGADLAEMLAERFGERVSRPEVVKAQRQMWTALRALRVTEAAQLGYSASTEDCEISVGQARAYLTMLVKGGYAAAHDDGSFRLLPAKAGPFAVLFSRGLRLDLNTLQAVNVKSQPSLHRVSRGEVAA